MSETRSGWKVGVSGLLMGLLAASSASGQGHIAAPTTHSVAQEKAKFATTLGLQRRILLPDGRALALEADGITLTIREAGNARNLRVLNLSKQRSNASVTLLPSGRVLIWGGIGKRHELQSGGVWLDPALHVMTEASDLSLSPRAAHTATVLTDGRVLLVGGLSKNQLAEVWDERTNDSVHIPTPANSDRRNHQARLQSDGRVRLTGGTGVAMRVLADLLFDPASNKFVADEKDSDAKAAPNLAGSLPVGHAQRVLPGARLSVRFTQPAKMAELNTASVTLLGPGGFAAIGVIPADNGRLVFVTPKQELFPNSKYTLLINGIRSSAGKPFPLIAVDFITAALSAEADVPAVGSVPEVGRRGEVSGISPTQCAQTQAQAPRLPCHASSALAEGVWTPGRDSTEGRWRVPGGQPDLIQTDLMSEITQTMGYTAVIGKIRRVDQVAVADVEVSLGGLSTRTNAAGDFILYNPPAGKQELYVDGTTANRPGIEYGQFVVGVEVAAGKLTQLPYTLYLPRISARDKIRIPSPLTRDVVLKHPDMPGLMVQIPAGTVIRDRKGRLVQELAIVPTPVNRAPFPVADNYPMYFTLEPGGAVIQGLTPEAAKGIRIFYPNYDQHPKGTQANFWIYDPLEGWRVYGKGRVTSDGRYFSPEAGVALHQTMGGSYSVDTLDPPSEEDMPPDCQSCGEGNAGTGQNATAGDPVDLRTGRFSYQDTDITISDVVPIGLSRSYRSTDKKKREFGLGTAANFNYKLYVPSSASNTLSLTLPNGAAINFSRVSGSGYQGSWRHTGSTTAYNGATIELISNTGYQLVLLDGSRMHFYKYAPNPLMWSEDKFGNRTNYVSDAGLITRIVSPSGRQISLGYDSNNRINLATDTLGHQWTYEYNASGLLSKVIYPDLTNKRYEYTTRDLASLFGSGVVVHNISAIYDRRGNRLVKNEPWTLPGGWGVGTYKDYARVGKQTLADGSVYTFDYAHNNGTNVGVLVTYPDTVQRRVTFSSSSSLYPATDTLAYGMPLAQTYQFLRNPAGQITARIDPLNRRTEYQYNANGQVTQVIALAGTAQTRTASIAYNIDGDVESVTDPLNRTATFGYTNRCLTSVTDPLGRLSQRECNVAGQPTTVTNALGHMTTLSYDGTDLSAITDALGRSIYFRYDALGRMIAGTDAQGNIARREFDNLGRVAAIYDPGGNATQIAYDGNNNVSAVLLPHGNGITYSYDALDRLVERTDSLNQKEVLTYDLRGRLATYTDRKNQLTSYQYDALNRSTVTTHPLAGGVVTASYDSANRLISLADSLSGTLGWTYNDFDDVIQTLGPQGNISYTYDTVGRRTGMTAASQAQVEYRYDAADRLTRILQGSEVVDFVYDNANRLTQVTLPNQVVSAYTYNAANELTGMAWSKADATLLGSLGYGYDSVGRQVAQTGTYAPQLLPVASTGVNTFDDNHRQTAYNGQTLNYDSNGNVTSDGVRTYVWNTRNQLTTIKQGASTIASFAYDALGRRIGRNEAGTNTTYLYDALNAVQETRGATVTPVLTGLGVDQRYARTEAGGRTYFLSDMLGSTRALTNASGTVVNRYDYDAYGTTTQTATGFTNPYQYTGREKDTNGIYYYRARYYQPEMARFISEDPIGLADGPNTYTYVGGNPVSYVDPTGEFGLPGLVVGAVIGAISGGFGAYVNGGNVWAGIGIGAASGALIGVTGAYLAGGLALEGGALLAATVGTRGLIGAASNTSGQLLNSDHPCWQFNWWSLAGSAGGGCIWRSSFAWCMGYEVRRLIHSSSGSAGGGGASRLIYISHIRYFGNSGWQAATPRH